MNLGKGKAVEIAITAIASSFIAIISSIGFSSPKEKLADHEGRIKILESGTTALTVTVGRIDQKLDDIISGLGVVSHHPR